MDHRRMRVCSLMFVGWLAVFNFAAGQSLVFTESTHNFGEVKEQDGAVSYTFEFRNNGSEPIQIKSVQASCGCTTPQWTKESIPPGESGSITAEYNPLNRPGKFNKSLAVSYSIEEKSMSSTLYIEGVVKPKPKTVKDELPTAMGGLRVKYKTFNVGKIPNNESVVNRFDVYNDSDTAIIWLDSMIVPEHISISFEPQVLKPQGLGEVVLTYDPQAKDDLGFVSDNVVLFTNEADAFEKSFNVITTIKEYFPEMSQEELARAPRLAFDRTQHDYGSVTQGNEVVTEFSITNNGEEDLLIRKIKPNCGCVVASSDKKVVKSGETIKMEVSMNTKGRRGRQYKTITVFSNDPTAPSQMISVKTAIKD